MFDKVFLETVKQYSVPGADPDHIAISCHGQMLSYPALNDEIKKMAERLNTVADINSLKGKRIALVMPKCMEHYIALLLIWRLGASIAFVRAPVFDENKWMFGEFPQILTGTETNWKVDLIISHSRYDSVFSQDRKLASVLTFYADLIEEYSAQLKPVSIPNLNVDIQSEAYTVFTSGTTGKPKGAINTHEGLASRNDSHTRALKLDKNSVVAQDRPLHIDASLQEIMMTFAVGARLVVVPEGLNDWQAYIDFYNENKITHAIVVPAILKQIHDQYPNKKESPFKTLRYILTTGESMSEEIYDYFAQFNTTMINGCGPSETTIGAFLWIYKKGFGVSIGMPMDGVEAHIIKMDENGIVLENKKITELTANQGEGQLLLSGLGIGLGYTNNPELQKQRFRYFNPNTHELLDTPTPGAKRCYLTGDKVSLKNGLYYIHGRYDRQLKLDSKLLSPEEIEEVIKQLPEVETAQVDVIKDDVSGRYDLIAGVKFKPEASPVQFERIQAYINQRLGADKVPTLWKKYEATRSNIDNQWKHAPLFKQPVNRSEFTLANASVPTTVQQSVAAVDGSIRKRVIDIFKLVLPNSDLHPNTTFQFLGGTSILTMRLAEQLRREFNLHFVREQLFKKSINDVVHMIEAHYELTPVKQLNEEQCKHHHEPKKNLPVFFIHALLGNAFNDYDRFAEFFSQRAIYGICARTANQPGNLDEYAQHYKKSIQAKFNELFPDQNGPYLLVGWSSGGVIAHRICELLRQEGHDVGLFLLDSTSSRWLANMSVDTHKEYAKTLAILTGRFLYGMMAGLDKKMQKRFEDKVERMALSDGLDKKQQIDSAFRQLENINEAFKKPELEGMMEAYEKNAKVIRDAWSIALGVLHYEAFDSTNKARKPKSNMHDREIGERWCRLFYAEVNKDKELGAAVCSHLGWEIGPEQITTLTGTHLSIMKKLDNRKQSEQTVPPEFEELVVTLKDDFEYLNHKWMAPMEHNANNNNNNNNNNNSNTSAPSSTVITSNIYGNAKIGNHYTGEVININSPAGNQNNSSGSNHHVNIASTISGNARVKNNYTGRTININQTKDKDDQDNSKNTNQNKFY